MTLARNKTNQDRARLPTENSLRAFVLKAHLQFGSEWHEGSALCIRIRTSLFRGDIGGPSRTCTALTVCTGMTVLFYVPGTNCSLLNEDCANNAAMATWEKVYTIDATSPTIPFLGAEQQPRSLQRRCKLSTQEEKQTAIELDSDRTFSCKGALIIVERFSDIPWKHRLHNQFLYPSTFEAVITYPPGRHSIQTIVGIGV